MFGCGGLLLRLRNPSRRNRYCFPGKPGHTMDLAFATARFALHRGDSLTASGPFTLILQKRGTRWLILHDHTSADPKP